MAILIDHYNENKFLRLDFIYRDNRPDQGCQLKSTSNDTGTDVISQFGWTNETLNRLVEMLTQFPMNFYDGYFSHYDETFEWKWYYETATNLYLIIIFNSGRLLTFKASDEKIREFGTQILNDMNNVWDGNTKTEIATNGDTPSC